MIIQTTNGEIVLSDKVFVAFVQKTEITTETPTRINYICILKQDRDTWSYNITEETYNQLKEQLTE